MIQLEISVSNLIYVLNLCVLFVLCRWPNFVVENEKAERSVNILLFVNVIHLVLFMIVSIFGG